MGKPRREIQEVEKLKNLPAFNQGQAWPRRRNDKPYLFWSQRKKIGTRRNKRNKRDISEHGMNFGKKTSIQKIYIVIDIYYKRHIWRRHAWHKHSISQSRDENMTEAWIRAILALKQVISMRRTQANSWHRRKNSHLECSNRYRLQGQWETWFRVADENHW